MGMAVDRRKHIVEAAAKSFALFGYKATTMDQVAKIANVGKGTIYTFFTNKEQLFNEIMLNLILEMKDLAEGVIRKDLPFFDNLRHTLSALLGFRDRHELTIRLSHEIREMGTPIAEEAMDRLENAIIGYIGGKISEAVGLGQIKPCDPEKTAFAMLKLYVAFVHDWGRSHPPMSREEIAKLFDLYLVEGLKNR
jgi:AcrR family transcriptional regulator